MKYSTFSHLIMKSLFISTLLVLSMGSMAQEALRGSTVADPKLGEVNLTDMSGRMLDPDNLQANQVLKLRIPVSNASAGSKLPAGSAKIKIGFGSKLQIIPGFVVDAPGLNNYFTWNASMNGGQQEVTGELINELPANTQEITVAFKVKAIISGTSTITANFLLTNHHTQFVLSDLNPNNNSTFLQYTISSKPATAGPLIKLTTLTRAGCAVNLSFSTENEASISRYDIEASRDGNSFIKVGGVKAADMIIYNSSFALTPVIETQYMLVRIRSVNTDGRYNYSQSVLVAGICEKTQPWALNVYPNPASNVKAVTINTKEGEFKGKYKVSLLDLSGQLIQVKDMQLDKTTSFRYEFGDIAAGKYLIQVVNAEGSQSGTMKFEKL